MVNVYAKSNGTAHVNGKLNGQVKTPRKPLKRKRGFWARTVNFIARIATWGLILTILLRCPASLETCDETSPLVCKPYFRVKNSITPHFQPYFDQYAAPYVNAVKPYYNTLNNNVFEPTCQYAVLYGRPLVNKGQNFAQVQWRLNGQPQLLRIQEVAKSQYNKSLAPHLTKASVILVPCYDVVQKHTAKAFNDYVLPGYELARPYAVYGYQAAAGFITTKALPATSWAWGKANMFLDTAVWPQLRVVYVENVEPQLVRIGERLGRYRTKSNATSKAVPAETPAEISSTASFSPSFSKPSPQNPSMPTFATAVEESEASSTEATEKTPNGDYWNPVEAPPAVENESPKRKSAREMVANDLATWQSKFASQAEEGASAIEDQVNDIAREIMCKNAQITGKTLVTALEETISTEVISLKRGIRSIVENGGSDALEKAVSAIRATGAVIKKKAQMVRDWREDYDAELREAVLEAAEVHFGILDETRNLALQKIGMKWAWTDGVTYKDWQKYHELKNTLRNWTEDLKQLIVSHPTLLEAQELSLQIEDDAMTMAATAAQELARLKDVAHWKIQAYDSTDNFETDAMRLAAEEAAQQSEEDIARPSDNEKQGLEDGEEQTATDEFAVGSNASASDLFEDGSCIVDPATLSEGGTDDEDFETPQVFITTGPTVPISPADSNKSGVILGDNDSDAGSSDDAESDLRDNFTAVEETMATPTDVSHNSVTAVLFGAAAQSVTDRSIIFDDDIDSDNSIGRVTNAAQEACSSAITAAADRYSSALSVVSAQMQGTSKPVHEQLFSSVSAAYDGAVSAASQRLNEMAEAASSGLYSVAPSATRSSNSAEWNKVESIAAQKLNEGRLWAEIQYQSILIALGAAQATPTPTSAPERYYEQAKYHYYAGLGLAQDRYSSFIAAASSAWSSATATQTPTDFVGSASSMASVAGKSAVSAASAADEAVKSAYTAASEGFVSAAQDAQAAMGRGADVAAEQVVNVAGAVGGTWENVLSRISADVYGQPAATGWYEDATQAAGSVVAAATCAVAGSAASASDLAAKQFDAVHNIISELVVGKEPTYSESIMSRLSAACATATSGVGSLAGEAGAAASTVGDSVVGAANQATEAVKEAAQQLRDEL